MLLFSPFPLYLCGIERMICYFYEALSDCCCLLLWVDVAVVSM